MRLIDNAIAIYQEPDFYSMRVAAAFVADAAEDVIETSRSMVYIFNNTVDRVEAGIIDAPPQAFEITRRQIETIRAIVDEIARTHDIPRYKTDQLDAALRETLVRLEAVRP
jgi:hypothetical protein